MFLVCFSPDIFRCEDLFDCWEELHFFVVMVAFHEPEPCQSVSDESGFVGILDMWCLKVDGVVASEYGVVDVCHVCCTSGEDVSLHSQLILEC